jgi:hypothetical protein
VAGHVKGKIKRREVDVGYTSIRVLYECIKEKERMVWGIGKIKKRSRTKRF